MEMEELVQDGVCRACGSFLSRCEERLPDVEERKDWVVQCAIFATKRACVAKTTFGNPEPKTGYVDAMDRRGSFRPESDEDWYGDALEAVHNQPVEYEVQRWEIEELLEREHVPLKLRKTAVYAAMGISQEESALLQGCCTKTVQNRMSELQEYFNPAYAVFRK